MELSCGRWHKDELSAVSSLPLQRTVTLRPHSRGEEPLKTQNLTAGL